MNESSPIAPRDHFSQIVPKWSQFGPPLRPWPDDSAVVQCVASTLHAGAHVVVLGLTPEIIACDWPTGVKLSAVDHSPSMIEQLWPPAKGPVDSEVLLADWAAMPFKSGTIDLVAGDGCYVLQSWPEDYAALTLEVGRVLRPGGRYVIRVFLRPNEPESIADIARDLASGRIGSVHAIKLRLLAAVHGASGAGSRLGDVFQAWTTMPELPAVLAGKRGWTAEEIVGIESYGGMDARYYLPTLAEFRHGLGPHLCELECVFGRNELAERCPTLVLARSA